MKSLNYAGLILLAVGLPISARAALKYELTIINGSQMPISPGAVYVKNGQSASAEIGQSPTAGFIQLCQTGNPAGRIPELDQASDVTYTGQTTAPILPGESRMIEVSVNNPYQQSIHFEAMYGKTKDTCAVGSAGGLALVSLLQHVTSEYVAKDDAISTGAFSGAAMPMPSATAVCADATDAVTCLRELAAPTQGKSQLRFFSPYLPSLVDFLEAKYGSADVQTLIFPSSGAVRFKVKLKR